MCGNKIWLWIRLRIFMELPQIKNIIGLRLTEVSVWTSDNERPYLVIAGRQLTPNQIRIGHTRQNAHYWSAFASQGIFRTYHNLASGYIQIGKLSSRHTMNPALGISRPAKETFHHVTILSPSSDLRYKVAIFFGRFVPRCISGIKTTPTEQWPINGWINFPPSQTVFTPRQKDFLRYALL